MTAPIEYVLQLKARLVTSPVVASFTFVEEKVWLDRGYIRIRMALSNGDFLEAAEYFVLEDDECVTHRYRYQWMDGERRELRKRWDNVEHYPDLVDIEAAIAYAARVIEHEEVFPLPMRGELVPA